MKKMHSWHNIVKPYPFLESLGKREDLFAADLGDVLTGVAHPIYLNPEIFVKTTHFTSGLVQFLESIQRKITTGEGNSVIRLQAQFGGGKTHCLIAAHHFLTNGKFFTEKLSVDSLMSRPKVVSIIGTHLNPLEGRQEQDSRIYTPWGELAYQLGGVVGFESLKENDQKRISPGKASLYTLLSSSDPSVILLDEITEFIAKAKGVKVNDSNLGLQTLIFLQELTDCIRSLDKSILIISLPDKEYETTNGDEPLLIEIDQILGRLASTAIPSDRADLYQIIQKKLIDEVLQSEEMIKVVDTFSQTYTNNKRDFPAATSSTKFKSLLMKSYPFHPATIDILIDKWNKLPSFQGTRTILSTLAKILEELRIDQYNALIISPSDINFTKNTQSLLFFRHLPSGHEEILIHELNIIQNLDHSKILSDNWKEISKNIISTIFLNSINIAVYHGASLQEINLAVWKPGINLALIADVLDSLTQTSEFLHKKDNRYFLSEIPNVNHRIQELKDKFENDALREIENDFISQTTDYPIKIYVWPKSSDLIPDDPGLKLVLFAPHTEESNYDSWIRFWGNKFRKYQNTILIGQINMINLDRLKNTIQEKLAVQIVLQNLKDDSLYVEEHQMLRSRLLTLNNKKEHLLNRLYLDFTDSIHRYQLTPPKKSEHTSIKWIVQELILNEVIVEELHPTYIKDSFLNKLSKIDTHSLLDQFLKDLHMPKLLNKQILQKTLSEGFEDMIFSFEDTSAPQNRPKSPHEKHFPDIISFKETEYIVLPNQAKNQLSETRTLVVDKTIKNKGLSFHFSHLKPIDLRSLMIGILEPLEREEENLQLEITINLMNPQNISNKMTLSLLKETVSQVGGIIHDYNTNE